MKKSLKILFVASEAVPFAKTGGLADVSGVLPKALKKLGHEIIVVMPRYYSIDKSELTELPGALGVPMGPMGELWAGIYSSTLPGSDVPVYFIDYEEFFGRSGLYADESGVSYDDNDNRFVFLSKAAFQLAKKLDFKPDIIHGNDWHTASVPILKNSRFAHDEHFANSATVLTIHNMQHQGFFFKGIVDVMEIDWEHFNPMGLESMDGVNMLKGGVAFADAVTTVSKKYAQELQTAEFAFGMQDHMWAHRDKTFGILNGVDYDEWSPSVDPLIPAKFDSDDMRGKGICKNDLREHFGLPEWDVPLIGFVGRFAEQKGIELIAGIIEGVLHLDVQFVFLGTGEKWAEGFFSEISARYPDKFAIHVGYDNELAHQIEAGSDLFLMPSLFEPCGLNQIYSLRYGTLPIVRATGGLDDTIENYDPVHNTGTGFKFEFPTEEALYHTIKWSVDVWHNDKVSFAEMQKRAMEARYSWEEAAKGYETVYNWILINREIKQYR
ncbi:MAG: glycogen/starch synthase [Campylobacterota bacterium]|nr:glycogen/starch synthase [Campylobacterota bacterium]